MLQKTLESLYNEFSSNLDKKVNTVVYFPACIALSTLEFQSEI